MLFRGAFIGGYNSSKADVCSLIREKSAGGQQLL